MMQLLSSDKTFVTNLTDEEARRLIVSYGREGKRVSRKGHLVSLPTGGFVYSHPMWGGGMVDVLKDMVSHSHSWAKVGGDPMFVPPSLTPASDAG